VSFRVLVEIVCDEPGCLRLRTLELHNRGGLNKTSAGDIAALEGWLVPNGPGHAFCPDHAAHHRRARSAHGQEA
jgi:hypothetical protein